MRTFSTYSNDYQNLAQNFTGANGSIYASVTMGMKLINDALRYLVGTFFFNEATYIVPGGTVAGQQAYNLPFNDKQIINTTVLIGSVLWQPQEIATRKAFDALNVIPFNNNYPQYYYIYTNQLLIWPTPAENGNPITMNYKRRIKDLSAADYSTGTVTVTNASTAVTSSGSSFTQNMVGRWLNVPMTTSDATSGDNEWYQIAAVPTSSTLTLNNQYQGGTATSVSTGYVIGEVPILAEDFQDLPLYRALYIYHNSIVGNETKSNEYKRLYDEGYARLDAEFGSKTAGVGLTPSNISVVNPNFYQSAISHA